MWHATDILITGRYSDYEISMFGEVIGRLAEEIEVAARAQLSELMSACDHAPLNVIEKLALVDEIADRMRVGEGIGDRRKRGGPADDVKLPPLP